MWSHFQDWIDYNGAVFSIELLEWGRKLSGIFEVQKYFLGSFILIRLILNKIFAFISTWDKKHKIAESE